MSTPNHYQDDEIDLFELVENLWQEKVLVLLVAFVVTAAAAFYAFLSPAVYQASVSIDVPLNSDLRSYTRACQLIMPSNQTQAVVGLTPAQQTGSEQQLCAAPESVFKELIATLASGQLRNDFFEQVYLPTLSAQQQQSPHSLLRSQMNQALSVNGPPARSNSTAYQVVVQLGDPERAAELANSFVSMAKERAKAEVRQNIEAEIRHELETTESRLNSLRQIAQKEREDEITRLQEALTVAKMVGQEAPAHHAGKSIQEVAEYIDRNQPYLRGSRALQAQISVLEQRENEDAFIPGVRELEARLSTLKEVAIEDEQAKVARISSAAQPPHQPIKPKRMLIVAVGIVLGGMLGVFAALIRVAIRNRKAANSQTASAQN